MAIIFSRSVASATAWRIRGSLNGGLLRFMTNESHPARGPSHHRLWEVFFQDVRLRAFKMAGDPRHGQLPRAEGGKDLREILHHHGLVPVEVRQARLPVVRIALGTKRHAWRIRFEFEWS